VCIQIAACETVELDVADGSASYSSLLLLAKRERHVVELRRESDTSRHVLPHGEPARCCHTSGTTQFTPTAPARKRFVEFFTANIRNPNTLQGIRQAIAE
jgi:hypothetical protein